MNKRKELNLDIRKSTLKTIRKYLFVIICCFALAIIYPFINIYKGEYRIFFSGRNPDFYSSLAEWQLDRVYLETYLDGRDRTIYPDYNSSLYWGDYFDVDAYNSPARFKSYSSPNNEKRKEIEDWFKEQTTIYTSIKLIFAFDDYRSVFWWTFFPLVIATIIFLNFKFKLKLKNE